MTASTWTKSDTAKAEQICSEYQHDHDLSSCIGKTAGIDPQTGRVWIGESIHDVLCNETAMTLTRCCSLNALVHGRTIAREVAGDTVPHCIEPDCPGATPEVRLGNHSRCGGLPLPQLRCLSIFRLSVGVRKRLFCTIHAISIAASFDR